MLRVYKAKFTPKDGVVPDEDQIALLGMEFTFAIGDNAWYRDARATKMEKVTPESVVLNTLKDLNLALTMDYELSEVSHPAHDDRDAPLRKLGLERGMYRVNFPRPGGRIMLQSQMWLFAAEGRTLLFSARPRFGTQEMHREHITSLEKIPDSSPCYLNWDPRRGAQPPAGQRWKHER